MPCLTMRDSGLWKHNGISESTRYIQAGSAHIDNGVNRQNGADFSKLGNHVHTGQTNRSSHGSNTGDTGDTSRVAKACYEVSSSF